MHKYVCRGIWCLHVFLLNSFPKTSGNVLRSVKKVLVKKSILLSVIPDSARRKSQPGFSLLTMSESERKSLTEKDRYEIPIWFKITFLLIVLQRYFSILLQWLNIVKLRRQHTVDNHWFITERVFIQWKLRMFSEWELI